MPSAGPTGRAAALAAERSTTSGKALTWANSIVIKEEGDQRSRLELRARLGRSTPDQNGTGSPPSDQTPIMSVM
jgi:hypothetical protein